MKTYTAKEYEVKRDWFVIDAEGVVLGRLAAEVSKILRGKNKPIFTPHADTGDNVVIINADKVRLTGNKMTDKIYYRHTGHPGGIKSTTPEKILNGDHPERVIKKAVKNMVPRGPLGRKVLTKLHVYAGTEHKHEAQKPKALDLAKQNPKNKRAA